MSGFPQPGSATPATVWGTTKPYTQTGATASSGANQARLFLVDTLVGVANISQIRFGVGAQSGNVDVGVYSLNAAATTLTKLASSGSTACPAISNDAGVTLSSPITLNPIAGPFYLALAVDNITATFYSGQGSANLGTIGLNSAAMSYRFTTAFPLPATLSIASAVAQDTFYCLGAR